LEGVAGEAVGGVFGLEDGLGMLVEGLRWQWRMAAGFLLPEAVEERGVREVGW
jgi:hypothetical protein